MSAPDNAEIARAEARAIAIYAQFLSGLDLPKDYRDIVRIALAFSWSDGRVDLMAQLRKEFA